VSLTFATAVQFRAPRHSKELLTAVTLFAIYISHNHGSQSCQWLPVDKKLLAAGVQGVGNCLEIHALYEGKVYSRSARLLIYSQFTIKLLLYVYLTPLNLHYQQVVARVRNPKLLLRFSLFRPGSTFRLREISPNSTDTNKHRLKISIRL
jgi:hypothetical protein